MNTAHLTEAQLQSYADDMESAGTGLKEHVTHCLHCRVKVENYRLINSALKAMPAPSFDFDLAEEVLASVARRKTRIARIPLLLAFTVVLLIALVASPYTPQIIALFSALPKAWSYLLTVPALVFVLVHLVLSLAEYQRRMNMLPDK